MRVILKNKKVYSDEEIPQSFYEDNKDLASTCIAMNIIKNLYNEKLITKAEWAYLQNKI